MLPLQRYFSSFSSSSTLTYAGVRCGDTCIVDAGGGNNARYRRKTSHPYLSNNRRHYGLIDVSGDDGSVVLFVDAYSPAEFHQLLTLLSSCCPACNEKHTSSRNSNTCQNNSNSCTSIGMKKNGCRKIRQLQIHRTRWNLQRTKADIKKLFETLLTSSWLACSLSRMELSGFAGTQDQSLIDGDQPQHTSNSCLEDEACDHELCGLAALLGRHFGLEHFELRLRSGTIPASLLHALTKVPMLQEVHLFLCDSAPIAKLLPLPLGKASQQDLRKLENSTTCSRLKQLHVYDNRWNEPFQLRHDHGVELVKRLQHNTTIESVFLQPGLDDLCSKKMVELVIRGNKKLHSLQWTLAQNRQSRNDVTSRAAQQTAADNFAIEIASAFQVNNSISTFSVHDPSGLFQASTSNTGKRALLAMLANNYTLEQFKFCGHPRSSNSRGMPVSTSLIARGADRDNNHDADFDEDSFQAQMHFFLRLNSLSRGRLLSADNVLASQWIDMLAENKDDLDCLFYILSQSPALCDVARDESGGGG